MACNCCGNRGYRYKLGEPRVTTNFIEYPTCKDVNVLARYGLVEITFPSIVTDVRLQVSILDCNSNTLVYTEDGNPLISTEVVPNVPRKICFDPEIGGYVIEGYSCFKKKSSEPELLSATVSKKEASK